MAYHYSRPSRESDPHALPDIETFYLADDHDFACFEVKHESAEPLPAGWYYWYCASGCVPDSDPNGPFTTEEDALAEAQENAGDDEGTETDRCDSCAALMINGVYCHETGCPNTPRHCAECGSPCDHGQRFCSDECAGYGPALDSFDEDE